MKIRSVLVLVTLVLAPLANAQSVDRVLVRAATAAGHGEALQPAAENEAASQEKVAELKVNMELVARDLDRVLEQRFNRDGDIPRPAEVLLVSN
ncbi:hypothetical protein FV139_08580 [Parahaliea maris]|uniref:Uncharacterized protein n=1 Tax=Parahaliea maris TaxID=2716870 RepID=A0A5C8ZYY7_9GAMM|nr:hypothetical protein [Parahaliea maris]TXS93688.1 hypothetical protein FV139_08580 [Parahaliea maris]